MGSLSYLFGPFAVQVLSTDRRQQAALACCWRRLFQIQPASAGDPARTILLDLSAEPEQLAQSCFLPAERGLTFANGAIWQKDGHFWLRTEESLLAIEATGTRATGWLTPEFWDLPLVAQRDFFQRLFFLLARRLGSYTLHANALYSDVGGAEAALLLIGDCGAGKTTLSLSLIRAGWGYIGDDTILLDNAWGKGVRAFGVRRGFACTQASAARWPDWDDLMATGIPLNREKRLLDLDQRYSGQAAAHGRPQVLLFPTITGQPQTTLRPLATMQTFLRLLDHVGAGVLVEPETTPALLTLFKDLVEQADAYELHLGQDVYDAPAQVSALLASLLV